MTPEHQHTSIDAPLHDYAGRVASDPSIREATAASVERMSGFQNRSVAASGHVLPLDEPVNFGGGGTGPDPAEALLAAVGASLSVTITAHAALQKITVSEVRADLSAWMSAQSFFDPHSDAPAGIQDAEIRLFVRSPDPRSRVGSLVRDAMRASPVVRSLRRRPRLILKIER